MKSDKIRMRQFDGEDYVNFSDLQLLSDELMERSEPLRGMGISLLKILNSIRKASWEQERL